MLCIPLAIPSMACKAIAPSITLILSSSVRRDESLGRLTTSKLEEAGLFSKAPQWTPESFQYSLNATMLPSPWSHASQNLAEGAVYVHASGPAARGGQGSAPQRHHFRYQIIIVCTFTAQLPVMDHDAASFARDSCEDAVMSSRQGLA